MIQRSGSGSGQLTENLIGRWVRFIQSRPRAVIIIAVLVTGAVLFYSIRNFRINTDINGMISEKLRFRRLEQDFSKAFPRLSDTIVIVIHADTADRAISARKGLADRLRKEKDTFRFVEEPGGGRFFERNGLLYLSVEDLEEFADSMAEAQPLLAILSQDMSLRGLFSVLGMVLSQPEGGEIVKNTRINHLFDQLSRAFDGVSLNRPYYLPWQEVMLGGKMLSEQRRQFVIVQPSLDPARLSVVGVPLKAVHRAIEELNLNEDRSLKVLVTGDVALSYETLLEVRKSTGAATAASLCLVGAILFAGLGRSVRLMVAGLATLLAGLVLTSGFALAAVGSLNMISITFAVLFIGLGIDYGIQLSLRYRELVLPGAGQREGVIAASRGVGRSLLLSAVTTAIGFYSFIPTAYAGVAELGVISGTGMFISFFVTVTLLPALLTLFPLERKEARSPAFWKAVSMFPYSRARAISAAALVLGVAAAAVAPKLSFDFNPLNLYNPESESVSAIKGLFKDTESMPWTLSVLAPAEGEAKRVAERLSRLREVKMAVSLADFVPEDQREKLSIISDVRLFMPPNLGGARISRLNYGQEVEALDSFESAVRKSLHSSSAGSSLMRLNDSIRRFRALLVNPVKGSTAFHALERELLSGLPDLFRRLNTSLQAGAVDESDLPKELVSQYVSADGRYRVQVFPREDILDADALKRFVGAVRSVAPDAVGPPVSIYESGRAVISSFQQATLYALVAITIFLIIEMRSFLVTALILVPLILAMLLTGAASVLLGIPLNFANVIVVPLLLGVGVHTGIIFILRYRNEPPPDGNMLRTSTARAVLVSTLITVISTGSLAFSPHRGISSMGVLLTICFGFLLLGILMLLPALLKLVEDMRR